MMQVINAGLPAKTVYATIPSGNPEILRTIPPVMGAKP